MPLAISDLGSGTIMLLIVIVVIPIAAIAFAGSGEAFKTLGKGQWAIEQQMPRKRLGPPLPTPKAVREAEIRQMVEAKSYRRQERGQPPLDVDAEVKRLMEQTEVSSSVGMDHELREEVRQLVIARNERRMRRGESPLDVEAEIKRQLQDLENLGQ